MVLVLSLVLNHAGRAVDDFVRADALVILQILTSKDVEAILTLYRFLLAVELEVLGLVLSFDLNFAILARYLNFATFFRVVLCQVLSWNNVFAKIANDQRFWTFLQMLYCLVSRSSAQSVQATKRTEELLVAADVRVGQKVLIAHWLPLWASFILTFDTCLLQNGSQFSIEALNLKVFSACWTSLTGHEPLGDTMLAINLLTMAAFLRVIDHSLTDGAFKIFHDLAVRPRCMGHSMSLFLVGYNYHFLILL